jgi:hypothetical protein
MHIYICMILYILINYKLILILILIYLLYAHAHVYYDAYGRSFDLGLILNIARGHAYA